MVVEEEQTKDKGVVLGVGDRRGLKDKIRDIYRRGRTKKGKELRIIPPPEMELTNEITVNSKEEDDNRDASRSKEESDIEIVSSGENRSHRLLDMKLFERLKKHPVLEDASSKEDEDNGNSLSTQVASPAEDEDGDGGLVDGTSTVDSLLPGADQESVTETTSGSARNYYPTTQRTNTKGANQPNPTLSTDVLDTELETTTNPPPSAPVPTSQAKPTHRITQKNKIESTPNAEPEPTVEPEPEPETTTISDHEFIKDPSQVLENDSDKSEALKLVPISDPVDFEAKPDPENESAPNPEPESEPEATPEPETTPEPESEPEPPKTDLPRLKIKTSSTPQTTPLAPPEETAPPATSPMTPADARVGFLDFVSTVDNTVMHFTLSSPEKDEAHLLTTYPVSPTRPPRPLRPTPPPIAPIEEVTPTPVIITSSPPPLGTSAYYPTNIQPTSVIPQEEIPSKKSHDQILTPEDDRHLDVVLSTRTPSRTFGRNFSPTKEQLEGDNTTFVPKAESSSSSTTAPTTTSTSRTTSRTTKPEAELSFQEKLKRRCQKIRQSTVR